MLPLLLNQQQSLQHTITPLCTPEHPQRRGTRKDRDYRSSQPSPGSAIVLDSRADLELTVSPSSTADTTVGLLATNRDGSPCRRAPRPTMCNDSKEKVGGIAAVNEIGTTDPLMILSRTSADIRRELTFPGFELAETKQSTNTAEEYCNLPVANRSIYRTTESVVAISSGVGATDDATQLESKATGSIHPESKRNNRGSLKQSPSSGLSSEYFAI